jgi:peptidoglycan/xylan/chitin deacetylase (PgdA/CDA1 family)
MDSRNHGIAAISAFGATNLKNDDTGSSSSPVNVPDKLVVLTFDDALKSHLTFVAPLLKELGFGATFFITHGWMPCIRPLPVPFPRANNSVDFLNWQEVAQVHQMEFEIGNHSWTHDDFSSPRNAARLRGELVLVENELEKVGVPLRSALRIPATCSDRRLSKLSSIGATS